MDIFTGTHNGVRRRSSLDHHLFFFFRDNRNIHILDIDLLLGPWGADTSEPPVALNSVARHEEKLHCLVEAEEVENDWHIRSIAIEPHTSKQENGDLIS